MPYLFTHEDKTERERLAAIEAGLDPTTIECLEKIGVREGWRCLDVGAGAGSIVEWLCRRVGPTGKVVATDLQTKFLEAIDASNLEVRQHDITREGDRCAVYHWLAKSDLTASMLGPPDFCDAPASDWDQFCKDYEPHFFNGTRREIGRSLPCTASSDAFVRLTPSRRRRQIQVNSHEAVAFGLALNESVLGRCSISLKQTARRSAT